MNTSARIGIDLGGSKIEGVLLDPHGVEEGRLRVATPRDDYRATVDAIADVVRDLEADWGQSASVGVGTPGTISPATRVIKNANSVWLNGRPLDADLAVALSRPVRLANDADCFALSEATDGAGRGAETVFGVIVGTGVGGGVVVRGHLLAGPNAIAGEWGHNPLPAPRDDERPGHACYCGRHGCIETFLSGPGLARDYAASSPTASGERRDAAAVVAAAAAGDAAAVAALDRYEDRLARALGTVINVLDPQLIVLGGGLSQVERLYTNVPSRWDDYVFSDRVDTRLVPPLHGDASGARGAAWLWNDR